jgi:hypothetical protein
MITSDELLVESRVTASAHVPAIQVPLFARENHPAGNELLLSKSDAAVEAALVVSGFRAGVQSVIDACVRTSETIARFRDDPSAVDDFLSVLVDGNLISRSEARLGLASPKLSKFRTIGHNTEMLSREQVFRYLPPGYTVIYQVTVLYNVLAGDELDRFDRLIRELDALSPLSREGLKARTEEIKREKRAASTIPSTPDSGDDFADTNVDPVVNRYANYKLALFTPDRQRDFWRMTEDVVTQSECYRLGSALLAEDAVAVVIARLADIPLIENRLLPIFGFSHVSHVCLIREPMHADVTDAEVLVVAHRNQTNFTVNFSWLPASEVLDAKAAAERLVPDATQKLHLLASEKSYGSGGWHSIIGNANWGQFDE